MRYQLLGLILLSCWSGIGFAFSNFGLNQAQQHCYTQAMVGMDSVINSRLGVPAEHALDMSREIATPVSMDLGEPTEPRFDMIILNVVLTAYLWEATPHSYAIKVFYDCASRQNQPQQVRLEN